MPYKEKSRKLEKDREYSAKRYEDFRQRKDKLCLETLGGRCYICLEDEGANEYHLHHLEYVEGESDYNRDSDSLWNRIRRLEEAEAHPERFRLLCPKCHRAVSSIQGHIERMVGRSAQRMILAEDAKKRMIEVL